SVGLGADAGPGGKGGSRSLSSVAARSGAESSAGQARAEGGGGFLRVGQKRQLAFHAGVLSARRRAIPFVSRIRSGEIRRKHDLIAHGAAALTRRTEKNDKWQVQTILIGHARKPIDARLRGKAPTASTSTCVMRATTCCAQQKPRHPTPMTGEELPPYSRM